MDYHLPPADMPFPFELFTAQKVVKACSQCGTSKTPQWREGPAGPKTLCNACGVKRCRQMRVASDSKRRASTVQKPAPVVWHTQDLLADEESCYTENRAPKQLRRGSFKAQHPLPAWSSKAGEMDSESLDTPAQSLSAGTAGINSDSAEEDAWSPCCASPQAAPPSPTYAPVGPECKAAVNLLAMSVRPAHKAAVSHHGRSSQASDDQDCKEAGLHQPSHSSRARACGAEPGLSRRQQWEQEEQQRLQLEVQELERQAVVAEAAVAAVAQVLAKKQAIATQAHFELSQAQKRARYSVDLPEPESTGSMPQAAPSMPAVA